MNRTLKGFLQRYCTELSGLRTGSLRRLCQAARENPRLVEPLFLFAAEQGKADYIAQLSKDAWFHDDYCRLTEDISSYGSVMEYLNSGKAPARYAAVLDAFKAQGDTLAADRRINGLIRPKIAAALKASGVTRYKLCMDLGLNPGNVYAYLAGDNSKVAAKTAYRMLEYAEGKANSA